MYAVNIAAYLATTLNYYNIGHCTSRGTLTKK
jgi:hypothetical protein